MATVHSAALTSHEKDRARVDFATYPDRYKHWKLTIEGRIATLALDVQEDATLVPGYELKLNSYDLGVDIELYDATPQSIKSVVSATSSSAHDAPIEEAPPRKLNLTPFNADTIVSYPRVIPFAKIPSPWPGRGLG